MSEHDRMLQELEEARKSASPPSGMAKEAVGDLLKLDAKGISPQALHAIYNRDIQGAMQHPGIVALVARRKERMRRIMDELENPMSHLKPKKPEPAEMAAEDPGMGMGMGPAAPGGPMPPSNLLGMFGADQSAMAAPGAPAGGMPGMKLSSHSSSLSKTAMGALRSAITGEFPENLSPTPLVNAVRQLHDQPIKPAAATGRREPTPEEKRLLDLIIMQTVLRHMAQEQQQKRAGHHPAELVKFADDEDGAESPQEEAAESLDPEIVQELVNTIVAKGPGIDDEDVHMKAESMGVNPHEAEEEIYRLLASLVGGQDDVVEGGLAAGMPTSDFPADQIQKGREVEVEHTPNPTIATEIAKDHLVEGEDYYEPRLDDLEKNMETAKDEGEIEGVNEETPKGKKNVAEKKKNEEKVKEARIGAFKYGYLTKVAELGLTPSEFMKSAEDGDGGGIVGWMGDKAIGAGKTVATAPMVAAPIIGALLGGGYRLATAPGYESPEEMRELELIALYKKLTRQALARAQKLQQARLASAGGAEKPIKVPAVA
jgi:hypothetical protein